jgi:coproporphyrinogen III oxidase
MSKLEIKFRPYSNAGRILVNLTFDRCFMQILSCRGQNETILVELESVPFYKYIWQEKYKRKGMEITAFKDKSHILPVLTFGHFDLNILS